MSESEDPSKGTEGESEGGRGRTLSRLEALIPELVRRAVAQGAEAFSDERVRDKLVADVLKKALTVGTEMYEGTEDQLRKILADLPRPDTSLPKDVVERLGGKLDEYKGELFRIVTDEVHEFLERIDLGAELQKMLTSLTFQITTEVRFVPSDKVAGAITPDLKSKVKVTKRRPKKG